MINYNALMHSNECKKNPLIHKLKNIKEKRYFLKQCLVSQNSIRIFRKNKILLIAVLLFNVWYIISIYYTLAINHKNPEV